MRPLLPTPKQLVSNGTFNLGTYKEPFTEINPLDANISTLFPLPRFYKNLRLKEWQHFALVNSEYYISLVLFKAKTLGFAQVCLYERSNRRIVFREKQAPSWKITVPMTLFNQQASFKGSGFTLVVNNRLDLGHHDIEFDISEKKDLPSLQGSFKVFENLETSEPIVVCLPLERSKAMYSHKYISALEGTLTVGGKEERFEKADSYGLIDIHKGYYPLVMKWNWATGGGFEDNRLIGFNLTDNQVKDQESYNENCLWIDNRIYLLPPVKFEFDKKDYMNPWKIYNSSRSIDLIFRPEVIRTVDINALIIANKYRAPFGTFEGFIQPKGMEKIRIDHFFGMCEDMYLRA